MHCRIVEVWLDAGMPQHGAAAARAHAARCLACGAALEAALAVDALLAADPAPAPAGFADRVLARIADARHPAESRAPAAAAVRVPAVAAWRAVAREGVEPPGGILGWSARVAAEPLVALSLVLWALAVHYEAVIRVLATHVAGWMMQGVGAVLETGGSTVGVLALAEALSRPDVALALLVGALPLAAWLAVLLFRWSEDFIVRRAC